MGPEGEQYFVKLDFDQGLYTLAARLHVSLFTAEDAASAAAEVKRMGAPGMLLGDGA